MNSPSESGGIGQGGRHRLWGFVVRWLKSLHELGRIDAETPGDLEQIVQTDVAASALDLTQERPVDIAAMGQGFLTEIQGLAAFSDSLAKGAGGRG